MGKKIEIKRTYGCDEANSYCMTINRGFGYKVLGIPIITYILMDRAWVRTW